jgi:hypothetical protein
MRSARPGDETDLVRLGWAAPPAGRILVGEIHGAVAAALAIDEHRAVGAPRLLAQMRARAAGIRAHARTPSVADRIRNHTDRRRLVGVWAAIAALPPRYG